MRGCPQQTVEETWEDSSSAEFIPCSFAIGMLLSMFCHKLRCSNAKNGGRSVRVRKVSLPLCSLQDRLRCVTNQIFARKPCQIGIERRDLERHLVMRREQADGLDVHHRQAITPGIDLDTSTERQGRDLCNIFVLQPRGGSVDA